MGYDNVNFVNYLYPKLTTIDNPAHGVGRMSVKLVFQNVYKVKDLHIQHVFLPLYYQENQ